MSDNLKDINETQLQEILKAMSKISQRKSPKKKTPKKTNDTTPTDE
jgi:hypothetical protein